jgi:hypothetical protein
MESLNENKMMAVLLKALQKGKGKQAVAKISRKDKKLGDKVKGMFQSILSLQNDIARLEKTNKFYKNQDNIFKDLGV